MTTNTEKPNDVTEATSWGLLSPPSCSACSGKVIAIFHPQAWVNDYAISVDPEGSVEFDITSTIIEMGRDVALKIQDDQYSSDDLRDVASAPEWIRHWSGPFYVEVEESIAEFFEQNKKL